MPGVVIATPLRADAVAKSLVLSDYEGEVRRNAAVAECRWSLFCARNRVVFCGGAQRIYRSRLVWRGAGFFGRLLARLSSARLRYLSLREPFVMGQDYADQHGNKWRCEGYRHPWQNTALPNEASPLGCMVEFTPLFVSRSRMGCVLRVVRRDAVGSFVRVAALPSFGEPEYIIRGAK